MRKCLISVDAQTVISFLKSYGLENDFKVSPSIFKQVMLAGRTGIADRTDMVECCTYKKMIIIIVM